MSDPDRTKALLTDLGTYGADFSRWPLERAVGAREAILERRDVRRAWERERELDRAMARHRDALDREIAASGVMERVRKGAVARLPTPLSVLGWQRIAAAMLMAGAFGGVMDLYLAQGPTETADVVLLDPLYGLYETEIQ